MSAETEQKFDDWATWFEHNYHRYPIVDPEQRWQFLIKTVQCQAIVMASLIEDVKRLERREPSARLYLPSGLHYEGDLTKVG